MYPELAATRLQYSCKSFGGTLDAGAQRRLSTLASEPVADLVTKAIS